MRAVVDGKLPDGVTGKDIILAIIGEIGTAGGTGYVLEYAGDAIRALSHGRPHDGLQHVDRRRRARRPGRAGREGVRLPERPSEGAEGRRLGRGDALLGEAALRRRRAFRSRDPARCRQAAADRDLGHLARGRDLGHRHRARSRRDRGRGQAALQASRAELHGPDRGHEDHRHQARPHLHRLLHQRPHRGSARGRQDRRRQDRSTATSTP